MGYRGNTPDSYTCELVAETYSEIIPLCHPRCMFQILEASRISPQKVKIGETEFTIGAIIGSYM